MSNYEIQMIFLDFPEPRKKKYQYESLFSILAYFQFYNVS